VGLRGNQVNTVIDLYKSILMSALAKVFGVLVEVPVMVSVCRMCVNSLEWYEGKIPKGSSELANG
jgi:arsenite transporter